VLYERPINLFVASFIGSPAMNLVQAQLERVDGGLVCRVGVQELALPPATAADPELQAYVGRTIGLGIRPEHFRDAALAPGTPQERWLRGRVVTTELLGFELLAHVEVAAAPVATAEVLEVAADVDRAMIEDLRSEAREHRTVFVGRFDAQSRVRVGDEIEVAVSVDNLHFFDLETELAIRAA
jgi:multiple sugar transport system ATP-binding protein